MGGGRSALIRGGRQVPAATYHAEAAEVFRFIEALPDMVRDGERTIGERASVLLAAFERRIVEGGAPVAAGPPARYALAVLIDARARAERGLRMSVWTATAHARLFDGRDISVDRIRRFRDTAARQGSAFAPLHAFLSDILGELETARTTRATGSRAPTVLLAAASVTLVLSLAAYAVFLDWRYHAKVHAAFLDDVAVLPEGTGALDGSLAARLDALAAATRRVEQAALSSPLAGILALPFGASDARARAAYDVEVAAALPQAIVAVIGETLATEGNGLALYDALRAWGVVSGETEWSADYLVGFLEDRPVAADLAPHARTLTGPVLTLLPPDPDLVAQARAFAAEVGEPERAWLELTRSDGARALPHWNPGTAVPGLSDVVVRRSGRSLDEGLDGLYTAAGWDYARDIGAGTAVQRARDMAPAVLGTALPMRNDAPDLVLDVLQRETLAQWKAWLADLRVRPFSDREGAILISGSLSQRASPLDRLIREVWTEVGGRDRTRPHALQVRIAAEFGAMIQYVEQDRIAELSALFSSLNVALGSIDFDEERGAEKLMSLQDRARSVAALAAAPPVIAQIAEDVLAQTSAAHANLLQNPLTRRWQQDVYPLCHATVNGRFPFHDGPDAALGDFRDLFGPTGALRGFVTAQAGRYLDTGASPWRWKPEARLSGLSPETATFLEHAVAISQAYFGEAADLGTMVELAALAERGDAMIFIGGEGVPVRASDTAEVLAWPGPAPEAGAEVTFRDGGVSARVAGEGAWGLLRLLDGTRLRARDDGARFLVDLRSDAGRIFLEMRFPRPVNPVAARPLLRGLTCPPVL